MATELEQMEREWIDEAKKICRLCNRAFPSVDVLMKHVEKSDLHRVGDILLWILCFQKNAEEKRSELARKYVNTSVPEEEPEHRIVYRDRAKERRAQYGLDGGLLWKQSCKTLLKVMEKKTDRIHLRRDHLKWRKGILRR